MLARRRNVGSYEQRRYRNVVVFVRRAGELRRRARWNRPVRGPLDVRHVRRGARVLPANVVPPDGVGWVGERGLAITVELDVHASAAQAAVLERRLRAHTLQADEAKLSAS